jgi:sporulation protein YlmC with PRC-barrel domain
MEEHTMKSLRLLLLAGALATSVAIAIAQSNSYPAGQSSYPAVQSTHTPRYDTDRNDYLARPPRPLGPHVCRAKDLIGAGVTLPKGEPYGKLDEIVVYPDGEIAYAAVSFGGFLGMGQKYVAVPWSALSCDQLEVAARDRDSNVDLTDLGPDSRDRTRERVTLWLSKEKLANAHGIDKSHWPEAADPEWSKEMNADYASAEELDRPGERHALEAAAPRSAVICKISKLEGTTVRSPDGNHLGDVEDVGIDVNGRVCYVVLAFGGVLGVGEHRVAVPWDALKIARDSKDNSKKFVTLDATRERLDGAPDVKPGVANEDRLNDPVWIAKVYDYFGVLPYWTVGADNRATVERIEADRERANRERYESDRVSTADTTHPK